MWGASRGGMARRGAQWNVIRRGGVRRGRSVGSVWGLFGEGGEIMGMRDGELGGERVSLFVFFFPLGCSSQLYIPICGCAAV